MTIRKRCTASYGFKRLPKLCSVMQFSSFWLSMSATTTCVTIHALQKHHTPDPFLSSQILFTLEYILILKASSIYLALPVRIAVGKILSDSHFFFSFSAVFFISSSSCLWFSSWALLNILVKLSKVDTTAENSKELQELAV